MFSLPSHEPAYAEAGNPPRSYRYYVNMAFLLNGENCDDKPHIGGTVLEATESSEGVKWLPPWVCLNISPNGMISICTTLYHGGFDWINQFHSDGQALVLRQSRLLNFRSDEPTTDAYHMVRWMANWLVGDTWFADLTAEEQEAARLPSRYDTDGGGFPIEVRGT